jgi:ribosomal protein S18 acetylase RimI-like enzyme
MKIQPYALGDEKAVIELWRKCNLTRPQNNPKLDIERKLKVEPELFLVGLMDSKVVAAVMGGYDGHRGWVYYLGVDPAYQRKGLGRQMMEAIEKKIHGMGCPKINLQVRTDNLKAMKFYERIGFKMDEVVGMGKRLVED